MASPPRHSRALPTTPKKSNSALVRDTLKDTIERLNADFDLDLTIPDLTLTPSRRTQLAQERGPRAVLCNKIYFSLHAAYFRKDLDSSLETFRRHIQSTHQPTHRPSVPGRGALSLQVKDDLKNVLLGILNPDLVNHNPRPRRIFTKSLSEGSFVGTNIRRGPVGTAPLPPPELPKRRSNEWPEEEDASKRTKCNDGSRWESRSAQQRAADLDYVAVKSTAKPQPKQPPVRSLAPSSARPLAPLMGQSFTTSANTSFVSLASSVFSANEDVVLTQTTIATQEDPECGGRTSLNLSRVRESGAPSVGDMSGIGQTNELMAEVTSLTDKVDGRGERGPTPDSIYSSFPSSLPSTTLFSTPQDLDNPLYERLDQVWPKFPDWLHNAPFAVAWEVTRIALHCGVDLTEITDLAYNSSWDDQATLRSVLRQNQTFTEMDLSLPEPCTQAAWDAALSPVSERVVLSAAIDFLPPSRGCGPLLVLRLQPIKLDDSHRLSRRFGSDRFVELLFTSPSSPSAPEQYQDEEHVGALIKWLCRGHSLVGRKWVPFFTKDAGYRKSAKEVLLGQDPQKPIHKERIYLFAEDGEGFRPAPDQILPPRDQEAMARTKLKVGDMLNWLLDLRKNKSQPYLKLFSRIALGLSRTTPVVIFEPHQILKRGQDLLSPTGNVMNDGIGVMSRSVAKKIQDALQLDIMPCAVQGRLGSAKGMWLLDVANTDGDWIETYPSQRKWEWECDDQIDLGHRTLEIRNYASELKSASLNLQFLPVLDDRCRDKHALKGTIGNFLSTNLKDDLDGLKSSLNSPLELRQWIHQSNKHRSLRVTNNGAVPWLAGLPDRNEDTMAMMVDAGFGAKQKYLLEMAQQLQRQKCETLIKKLNIGVRKSTYAYMVVDFWGLLEEDEVHICFSNNFEGETLLHKVDVLVARSPAHYVSDVQRVKAVFKTELRALKDVVVFPAKGNIALADKLSGGDYDGDMAWVCWDADIVENFQNADVPEAPNLFNMGYLSKVTGTFSDLMVSARGRGLEYATMQMVEKSFTFNMRKSYLGLCTVFKEKLCYTRGNVHDDAAVLLSTLLSSLVDQSKQGIVFTDEARRKLEGTLTRDTGGIESPRYKDDSWSGKGSPVHIIDHMKFEVAKPMINDALRQFHETTGTEKPEYWDTDLVTWHKHFKEMATKSRTYKFLMEDLKQEIRKVKVAWDRGMMVKKSKKGDTDYTDVVMDVYEKWCAITPTSKVASDSKSMDLLLLPFVPNAQFTPWALLRASMGFNMTWEMSPKFVWKMAGRELMYMKALATGRAPVLVVPELYGVMKPDTKMIRKIEAMREGEMGGGDVGDGSGGMDGRDGEDGDLD